MKKLTEPEKNILKTIVLKYRKNNSFTLDEVKTYLKKKKGLDDNEFSVIWNKLFIGSSSEGFIIYDNDKRHSKNTYFKVSFAGFEYCKKQPITKDDFIRIWVPIIVAFFGMMGLIISALLKG